MRPGFGFTQLIASYNASTPGRDLHRGLGPRPHRHRAPLDRGTRSVAGRATTARSTGCRSARNATTSPGSPSTPVTARSGTAPVRVAAAAVALPANGQRSHARRDDDRRHRVAPAQVVTDQPPRIRRRPLPRRAALLAGDPPWRVPAVQRWRGGLVQPHVHVDGDGFLARGFRAEAVRLGQPGLSTTAGSTTPRATPTRGATTAPACGRSTPRTPRASDSTRSSPGCGRCARRSCSSRPESRSSRPSRSVAGSSTAHPSRATSGHLVVIRGFTAEVASSSTTPLRRRTPVCDASTGGPVRERLDRQRRRRLRHPPALEGTPRPRPPQQLVGARRRGLASGGTRPER